nr:translation initiation factor IF-2-like [Aegilops tauschii subsp. strangulata]
MNPTLTLDPPPLSAPDTSVDVGDASSRRPHQIREYHVSPPASSLFPCRCGPPGPRQARPGPRPGPSAPAPRSGSAACRAADPASRAPPPPATVLRHAVPVARRLTAGTRAPEPPPPSPDLAIPRLGSGRRRASSPGLAGRSPEGAASRSASPRLGLLFVPPTLSGPDPAGSGRALPGTPPASLASPAAVFLHFGKIPEAVTL